MPDDKISFEVQSLLDVFAKTLFKNPEEDVLRELLTNAQDASILRRAQEPEFMDPLIGVHVDESNHSLTVTDNGIGMTEEDLQNHFATLGSSSSLKREASRMLPGQVGAILGSYGMGTIASFIIHDLN